jgi:hypothetical protein
MSAIRYGRLDGEIYFLLWQHELLCGTGLHPYQAYVVDLFALDLTCFENDIYLLLPIVVFLIEIRKRNDMLQTMENI